jgi:hypothetical protein
MPFGFAYAYKNTELTLGATFRTILAPLLTGAFVGVASFLANESVQAYGPPLRLLITMAAAAVTFAMVMVVFRSVRTQIGELAAMARFLRRA